MSSSRIPPTALLLTVGWLLAGTCAGAEKPNIVLLFIDDWAWNGTPIPMRDGMENSRMPVLQMPNVERLAREGMKLSLIHI